MANIFLFTTIAIVVSSTVNCERRAFLRNANNLPKAVLHHFKHDKEELNQNLVKNAGQPREEMKLGPRPPPLYPNSPAQWLIRAHQNHLSDKVESQQRIQQLQNKLNNQPPNRIPIQTLNQPHPKPDIEVKFDGKQRHKREVMLIENDFRQKRNVVISPQMQPEVVMQPHIQPALLQEIEAQNQEKDAKKRDKRQIVLLIKQQPLNLGKKPRTTPNPFIRETNIADYEIGKTNVDKPEIDMIDTVDTDSYQLNEEASEFSNILSNFYLTSKPEYWPEIQQFSEKVLKPLSELMGSIRETNFFNHKLSLNSNDRYMVKEKLVTNRRVKRKLPKPLIRKRAKKRKQKQRRVERKRLRMLTHARRLRKQRKSKLARLQRHYARMNLTTTMPPDHQGQHTVSGGKDNETGVVTINGKSVEQLGSESEYDTESDSEYYNTESESDDDNDKEDGDEGDYESDMGGDNGNDEYEEYDEESSSSHEYVDYENVDNESNKGKENKNEKKADKKKSNKIIKNGSKQRGNKS